LTKKFLKKQVFPVLSAIFGDKKPNGHAHRALPPFGLAF
jgi:hypothetical protein